jgi:phage-related protein
MSKYKCYYYRTTRGKSPVEEFIDSLDRRTQVKFFYKKGLLEEFGPKLPFPHARYIGEGLYELRFEGREGQIRILYFFFYKEKVIFAHGFVKKTQKIPKKEIEIAIYRKREFLSSS